MSKKRGSGPRIFFGILLAAGALVTWGSTSGGWFESEADASIEGTEVRRGALRISETVRGNLEAKDSISIKSEVESRATILYLIPEGTWVQEGDLICELDVSATRDERVVQEIALQNALAEHTKAKEQYDIQVIQNESDIAVAKQNFEFAEIDLRKYQEGDWPQELQLAAETIVLKEEELARAEDKLVWTKTLADRGFLQRTELEADQFAVERAKIEHQRSLRDKALLIEYGNPRQVAELEAKVEETEREVRKVEKQAKARLADFEAARASAEARLELEQEKLAKIELQIEKARMFAPAEGMVVYARESSRWGSGDPISEGTEVRERQEIMTIPRSGGMVVEASLHETVLKKVQVGQPCDVVIDALSGQVFDARVDFVAVLPDSQSWYSNPNQRVYRSEVAITEPVREMRPGMSCSVEILAAELEDVLYVPVQSVFLDAGKPICFVRGLEGIDPRPVKVGLDNSKWVVVEEGLTEGEVVLLSPPADFTPRAAERVAPGAGSRGGGEGDGRPGTKGSGGEASSGKGGGAQGPGRGGAAAAMGSGTGAGPGAGSASGSRAGGMPAGMDSTAMREAMRKRMESGGGMPEGADAAAMREAWRKRMQEGGSGGSGRPGGGQGSGRPGGGSGQSTEGAQE